MDPTLVFLVLAAAGAGAAFAWYNGEDRKVRRLLAQTPRRDIAAFAVGEEARIVGRVTALGALTAPLSGRPCVFYELVVDEHRSAGRGGDWHRLFREADGLPFLVVDATGRALVDPTHARFALELDTDEGSGVLDDPGERHLALLARHGVDPTTWLGTNRKLRYRECVIEAGDLVAAAGVGAREVDPDANTSGDGYRDRPTRLALRGQPGAPILLSDCADTTG